jgi:hypothetical protein
MRFSFVLAVPAFLLDVRTANADESQQYAAGSCSDDSLRCGFWAEIGQVSKRVEGAGPVHSAPAS